MEDQASSTTMPHPSLTMIPSPAPTLRSISPHSPFYRPTPHLSVPSLPQVDAAQHAGRETDIGPTHSQKTPTQSPEIMSVFSEAKSNTSRIYNRGLQNRQKG